MAYVAPRTWTGGETITAALLNAHIRDNQKALSDAWTAFTPTLSASTTPPTLGTASVVEGFYRLLDKFCVVHVAIQFGTSGTAAGSGDYIIGALPADPIVSATALDVIGTGVVYDVSATTRYLVTAERTSASAVKLGRDATSGFVTHAAPIGWAASDSLHLDLTYQVT